MAAIFSRLGDKQLIIKLHVGAVGIIPTDTLYGLVCMATNRQAVARLYKLKQREHKPGTIIAANINQLIEVGLKARYLKAAEIFWPNPISVIIPSSAPDFVYLRQNKPDIAVRIPAGKSLNTLLTQTGPLLTTSANQAGKPPAQTVEEAELAFGDSVDFYVQGGSKKGRKPSTIIRIIDDAVEVLRPGAVKIDETGAINNEL